MSKRVGLLFGINYTGTSNELHGCVNDVENTAAFLENRGVCCNVYSDTKTPNDVSYAGMVKHIYDMAARTYSECLEYVWISYSGHGSQVACSDGDEPDGLDEVLVPLDYDRAGFIKDDLLCSALSKFNPKTKVFVVIDACHSGSALDPKYGWTFGKACSLINVNCPIKCRLTCVSGCRDTQTSADAYNSFKKEFGGALTASILECFSKSYSNDVFELLKYLKADLRRDGFDQVPCLTSTYNLNKDPCITLP
jgi:hypothetical protein